MPTPLQKGNAMNISIPAGEYYFGDPCYAFGHDSECSEAWATLLDSANFFQESMVGSTCGHMVYATRTAYGDGLYDSTEAEFSFGVDSGLIGVIPAALVEKFKDTNSAYALKKFTFYSNFVFHSCDLDHQGNIKIGSINIFTNPDDLDD